MTLALLLALFQANPTPAAPPPPIVRTMVAPPPIITTAVAPPPMIVPSMPVPSPPVVVDVRVTAGGRILFADEMRVDDMMGASYSQSRSESPARACKPYRYGRQQSTTFNLRLNARSGEAATRLMSVSVSWSRPIDDADCTSSGTRSASIDQTVAWEPGRPLVLTGDGGLRVELRPR